MSSDDIYDRPKGPWEKIRTVLVGILVGMLVLAFAVWGIEDVFSPNRTNAIVKVGDAEVSRTVFMDRYNDEMRAFAEENGEGLTPQQSFDRGIPQRIVSQFAQDLAIKVDADDLGIAVNNRDVQRYVENIDAFRNEITQEFDQQQLDLILRSNRISIQQFEDDIVNALTQRQTLPAIMGGIEAPTDFARRYNTFVNEVRQAKVLRFGTSVLDPIDPPTDTELESFIAANQARFTAPEYRRFLMLRVEPFDYRQDVEVTEEQLRNRFDTLINVGEIGSEETRDVSVIAVDTREQADAIAARLTSGEALDALVTELSLSSPTAFDGVGPDALINPESSTIAFELDTGTAGVASTAFDTFEVILVRTINPAEVPDFDAMRDELRDDVVEGEARREINELERRVDDLLLEGATLEDIARDIGVPLSSYPFIDRLGTTQDGIRLDGFSLIPGVATDDRLLRAIFTSDVGFESDIIATSNNGLAVLRVDDVIESTSKPLEEVREQATEQWLAQRRNQALIAKSVELSNRIKDGEAMSTVAEEVGAELRDIAIQRASPPTDVSREVLVELLAGDIGDVVRGAGAMPETYEIGRLETISTGTDQVGGQILDIIRGNVSEQIALDVSQAYQSAIIADKEQVVFEDQMRAALGLDGQG